MLKGKKTKNIPSTLKKRFYAWVKANKLFTTLTLVEIAGALYVIFKKDGEYARWTTWRALEKELKEGLTLKYHNGISLDQKAATLSDVRAAKAKRLAFAKDILGIDMTTADAEAKFATALALFEKLEDQRFDVHSTLAERIEDRNDFARNNLGIRDLRAPGAEAQFDQALAEFDKLEKAVFKQKTLAERRYQQFLIEEFNKQEGSKGKKKFSKQTQRKLSKQKKEIKARITFTDGTIEIHDLRFVSKEELAGKNVADIMSQYPKTTSVFTLKKPEVNDTSLKWVLNVNCKGKTTQSYEWVLA